MTKKSTRPNSPLLVREANARNPIAVKVGKGRKAYTVDARAIAREALRSLPAEVRAELCPLGLVGETRRLFVEEGITLNEQLDNAVTARKSKELAASLAGTAPKRTRTRRPRKADAAAKTRTERKRTSSRKPRTSQPLPAGALTPAVVAEQAGVTPFEVRRYLRSQDRITKGPQGWSFTKAQAGSIVKALAA